MATVKELDRWASVRACVLAWLFAASVWSTAAMSRDIGRREATPTQVASTPTDIVLAAIKRQMEVNNGQR